MSKETIFPFKASLAVTKICYVHATVPQLRRGNQAGLLVLTEYTVKLIGIHLFYFKLLFLLSLYSTFYPTFTLRLIFYIFSDSNHYFIVSQLYISPRIFKTLSDLLTHSLSSLLFFPNLLLLFSASFFSILHIIENAALDIRFL